MTAQKIAGFAFLVCSASCGSAGCGDNVNAVSNVKTETCSGVNVSGVLQDSLSHQPVSRRWAVLESGAADASKKVYTFTASQQVQADATGAFRLCASITSMPLVLVAAAVDSSGYTYPLLAEQITTSANLGVLAMGGCTLTCGLPDQQQTSPPATVKGQVMTTSAAEAVAIEPLYPMLALDGSNSLWNIIVPALNGDQNPQLTTQASGCTGANSYCAEYTLPLPSQNPLRRVQSGFLQSRGAPVYAMEAALSGASSCAAATEEVFTQGNGALLTASPGAALTTQQLVFTQCH